VTMRNITNPRIQRGVRERSLRKSAVILIAILGSLWASRGLGARPGGESRSVIFVRVPPGACWQDFAFLAAVPAAMNCNNGAPALIALDESCTVGPEIDDYLRRYKPRAVYCLGSPEAANPPATQPAVVRRSWTPLAGESADSAAWSLASTFFKTARMAVLCCDDDYALALTASSLAGRLRAPMLYVAANGMTPANMSCLRKLGVRQVLVIGPVGKAKADLKRAGLRVVELADVPAVLGWMRRRKLPMGYLAVTNPDDRDKLVIRKLSLTAPLLAAARGGVAVGLAYKAIWKAGFTGTDCKDNVPKGVPASKKTPRKGVVSVGDKRIAYVATGPRNEKDFTQVNFDLNSNGEFSDAGEGPFRTGDVVTLAGRRCSVTLGQRNGLGKADVRITAPCAERILTDLKGLYAAMGSPPEHLAIVSMPDGIPHAIVAQGKGSNQDMCSDFPFTNADEDLFGEVALGRVTAENLTFATLYASRVITYPSLLDATWADKAAQARWENAYASLFENVGFTMAPHHSVDKLRWIRKPAGKSRGRRARGFGQGSPLTSVAAIVHTAHSWWHELGQTYHWDSHVLLAPVLVESGGCITTALDRQADFHSVVARLMRNGAVGFVGNSRPATAFQEQQRMVFWNEVLAGRTTGQAQLEASNWAAEVVLETGQQNGGPNYYMLHLCGLFGDPGFTMHVPSKPRSAPARVEVKPGMVSVYAPAQWRPCKIRVPEDWKLWKDKALYVIRGAGTWPNRHWVSGGYDAEETYVGATLTVARKVKSIEQVQSPRKPLGWTGKFVADENADGTTTYRWRVRMVDFNHQTGKIISKVDRLDYKVTFAD